VRGLLELLRPYRGKLSLMFVALLFATAAALAPPPLAKMAIDDAIVPGDLGALTWIVIAFVISALVYWGASYAQTYLVGWVGQRALQDLRKRIFAHLQSMPVGFYERRQAGVLISRMTNDVQALDSLVTDSIVTLFQASLTLIGTIAILAYLDLELGAADVPDLPAAVRRVAGLPHRVGRRLRQDARDDRLDHRLPAGDAVGHPRRAVLRQEPRHLARFAELNDDNRDANLKTVYLNAAYFPAIELVARWRPSAILVYGGLRSSTARRARRARRRSSPR
jgi:ATP-binding cassette subfamily B protein